ncbi:MAG TPA: lipoyl(octanoyl) transferase LipB [Terriglobales bacterium]|nr:lipoyl(octanoyl) transferase LipB [Terriglobales bacterium]
MISVLHLGTADYGTALGLQKSLVELRKQNRISDVLLLLEHPAVITLGRNASQKNLLASSELLQKRHVEVFESDRGGDITFHGPGQLVGYPIFDLRGFSPRIGAVEFVRRIEEALIRTCGDLGIPSERICGLTGVWTQGADAGNCKDLPGGASPGALTLRSEISAQSSVTKAPQARVALPRRPENEQKKIAAIGVHISRGITSHGFALNITTDLDYFKLIVPCGISDRSVTSIAQELAGKSAVPGIEEVAHAVSLNFGRVFAQQMLWLESLDALLNTATPQRDDQVEESESTTIGVPLKVPNGLRELRREQKAPLLGSEDEISLA